MKPSARISLSRPTRRPANCHFSSGPTRKRPGWSPDVLSDACLGRSHRAKPGKAKLQYSLDLMRQLLRLPDDYLIGIVPASDTGAVEMAMWSLLGARGVDMLVWDAFGKSWATDAAKQLKLDDLRIFDAPYGQLPDFGQLEDDRDVVLTWNGTSAGVRVRHDHWINSGREGLIIADATSAAFAMPMPIDKLDVVTFSWQKSLGGEAAHGVLVLSPKAVQRLESYTPPWPIPKIFQLAKDNKLIAGIFTGATINTPSMLCVEDAIDALEWAQSVGGLDGLIARTDANFTVIDNWMKGHNDLAYLAQDRSAISPTSITLTITADWFTASPPEEQAKLAKDLTALLEEEGVALDIDAYRDAPPGLRIWGGPTVEAEDLAALTNWIDWGLHTIHMRATAQ
ncbi:MAG: phosphoserine transaminase [Alphaproteobacteria bacterium]|nr:phosphoserine transaminase [Alphaproteobacteria bacterium]